MLNTDTYKNFLFLRRSMFYTSLGRLLMVDLGEDEEKFDAFMMPLTQSFESLGQVLLNQSSGYNSEEVSPISNDKSCRHYFYTGIFLRL